MPFGHRLTRPRRQRGNLHYRRQDYRNPGGTLVLLGRRRIPVRAQTGSDGHARLREFGNRDIACIRGQRRQTQGQLSLQRSNSTTKSAWSVSFSRVTIRTPRARTRCSTSCGDAGRGGPNSAPGDFATETGGKYLQMNNLGRVGLNWNVTPVKGLNFNAMYNALFAPESTPTRDYSIPVTGRNSSARMATSAVTTCKAF